MLDLDQEIIAWREAMTKGGVDDPAVLDELESHLRDCIDQEVRSGRDLESAFRAGLERIGPPGVLRREFSRANPTPILAGVSNLLRDDWKCFCATLALSVLVSFAFYYWQAQVTPLYKDVATLQLFRVGQQPFRVSESSATGLDVRSAEDLNAFLKLLSSESLRRRVAESLTPAEQQIVRRTTAGRRADNSPAPMTDLLGSIEVRARGTSLQVSLTVVHEDAEAAALITNRYVEQCRLHLAKLSELSALAKRGELSTPTFLVVDVPNQVGWVVAPNRTEILQASVVLALATLAGLLIAAAVLRKFSSIGMPPGPQLKAT
jgi:hypothetical protein